MSNTATLTMEVLQKAVNMVKALQPSVTTYYEIKINPKSYKIWHMLAKYQHQNNIMPICNAAPKGGISFFYGIPISESEIVPEGMLMVTEWDLPIGTQGAKVIKLYYTKDII